jgi:hypothetical protein
MTGPHGEWRRDVRLGGACLRFFWRAYVGREFEFDILQGRIKSVAPGPRADTSGTLKPSIWKKSLSPLQSWTLGIREVGSGRQTVIFWETLLHSVLRQKD